MSAKTPLSAQDREVLKKLETIASESHRKVVDSFYRSEENQFENPDYLKLAYRAIAADFMADILADKKEITGDKGLVVLQNTVRKLQNWVSRGSAGQLPLTTGELQYFTFAMTDQAHEYRAMYPTQDSVQNHHYHTSRRGFGRALIVGGAAIALPGAAGTVIMGRDKASTELPRAQKPEKLTAAETASIAALIVAAFATGVGLEMNYTSSKALGKITQHLNGVIGAMSVIMQELDSPGKRADIALG